MLTHTRVLTLNRSIPSKKILLKILTKILVKISLRSCCKILQDYGTKKFHNLVRSYARSYSDLMQDLTKILYVLVKNVSGILLRSLK